MVVLFLSSLSEYLTTSTMSQMLIDDSYAEAKININFAIEFTKVPCDLIFMDAQDYIGFSAEDLNENISRKKIINGVVRPKDVWTRNNDVSYDSLKQMVINGEGCLIEGSTLVNKVPGNIHFSTHNDKMMGIMQRLSSDGLPLNFAHKIVRFSFGKQGFFTQAIKKRFPEIELFPLEGVSMHENMSLPIAYQYYLNVVRTVVQIRSNPIEVYQYTISKSFGLTRDLPALFFKYEMSPLYVRYDLKEKSIWHFIVNICAIIGGVYTVFSILDAIVYSSVSKIFKSRIGKLS